MFLVSQGVVSLDEGKKTGGFLAPLCFFYPTGIFSPPSFLFPFLSSSLNLLTILSTSSTAPSGLQCPCFLSCFTIRSLSLFLISLPPPRCLSANRRLTYNRAITMPTFHCSQLGARTLQSIYDIKCLYIQYVRGDRSTGPGLYRFP